MSLPKEHIRDGEVVAKAKHMLSRHSDDYVSDYLGMTLAQVQAIRKTIRSGIRGRPPRKDAA